MADSKYFGIPFGTSGDKSTIPEAVQPSGAMSYTQGYGPDYERDPATDPLAKRVPRDETNELYFQVTNALKFLQLYGTPEWYATDGSGNPVSYPLSARVRHDAGAGMQAWRSIVASNTAEPGTDADKWMLDTAFDIASLEATLAEALAASLGTKIITPRRLGPSVQQGKWNYAVAAGNANALTATLSPAPASLSAGMKIALSIPTANTGAVTLNVNGLGAASVTSPSGAALNAGDLQPGISEFIYSGSAWIWTGRQKGQLLNVRYITSNGAYTPTPGTRSVLVEVQGGGGAGGGAQATGSGQISAGAGGGAGGYGQKYITSGFSGVMITVGAGGTAVVGGTGNPGGSSSFGSLVSATGGTGGDFGVPLSASAPTQVIGKGLPGTGSGGDLNTAGGIGKYAVYAPGGSLGGEGGASHFGSGAIPSSGTSSGFSAVSAGSGGGGACLGVSTGSAIGGAGAAGMVVVWEYA